MTGVRLHLEPDWAPSRKVADYVACLAARTGLPARQAYWLRLAADEITTNIAQHGYRCRGGVIVLHSGFEDDIVWLRIESEAPAFDPVPERQDEAGADPATRGSGGYGLLLARASVDELHHDGTVGSTTLVVRRRDRAEPGEPEPSR